MTIGRVDAHRRASPWLAAAAIVAMSYSASVQYYGARMRLRHAEILPRTLEAPGGRRTIQRARPGKLDLWGALPVAHVAFQS